MNCFGTFNQKLDVKNRIFVPAKWGFEKSDEIAIATSNTHIYSVYLLEHLNRLIDDIQNERLACLNEEKAKALLLELNGIFDQIKKVTKLDAQGRIVLPHEELEEKREPTVTLLGKRDHFNVFLTQDSYDEYQSSLVRKSTLL